MKIDTLVFAEGVSVACGVLMLLAALLLWQNHPKRPLWGLRWIAVAIALAAVYNLISPLYFTPSWRGGVVASGFNVAGLLAMMVGYASLAAMAVGILDYVLKPLKWRWLTFLALWLLPQFVVVLSAVFFKIVSIGDVLASGFFLFCSWHTWNAAKNEAKVGHLAISLAFLTQPLTIVSLTLLGIDLGAVRYIAALPYMAVALIIISACMARLYNELNLELSLKIEAQQIAKATQQALRRNYDFQKEILQQVPIPISFTSVLENNVCGSNWNQAWYNTFGYTEKETAGLSGDAFNFYVNPELRQRIVHELLRHGVVHPFEVEVRHASGGIRLCMMQGVVLNADEGRFIITSFVDITEQRAGEIYLRQYQSMVQNAADAMLVLEKNVVVLANDAASKMFGMDITSLYGLSPHVFSVPLQPDGRTSKEAIASYLQQAYAGIPQHFYWRHIRTSGDEFTAHVSLTLIADKSQQLVAVLRDVTDELEKSKALARSEERLKTINTVSNTGSWEFHGDSGYLWCSPEYFTMLGYNPHRFAMDGQANLNETWYQLLHPEDLERAKAYFADYLHGGSVGMYENQFRMRHRDGRWIWILSRGQTLRNTEGSTTDVTVGTHVNITEQKLIELELDKARRLSEIIAKAQLEFILQSQHSAAFDRLLEDILLLTDSAYGFIGEVLYKPDGSPFLKTYSITNIAWNKESQEIYDKQNRYGMEFTNLNTLFGQVMATGRVVIANEPTTDPRRGGLPPGHPSLNAFLGVPVYHGAELVAMFGVANRLDGYSEALLDYLAPLTATIGLLTVAIRKDKKQQETEHRLGSISNNLPNSMLYQLSCGKNGEKRQFVYISEGVEQLHGLSCLEVLADANLLYSHVHPDDLEMLRAKELECINSRSAFAAEYRGFGADGRQRWFYVSSTPSWNSEGELVFDGIEVDITERKLTELALQDERVRLTDILEGTRAGTWDLNLTTDTVEINERWAQMLGYSKNELGQLNLDSWRLRVHPDDLEPTLRILEQHLTGMTEYYSTEFRMRHKNGGWVWIQASGKVISRDAEGKPQVIRGTHLEVTERKLAEQNLQELNATLEARVKERTETLSLTLDHLKNTQDELIQAEKLAALGSLVAGVAHELNTPIGNAVTVSSVLAESCHDFHQKQQMGLTRVMLNDFVDTIDEAAIMLMRNLERAADLVSSFKQVAVDQNNHLRRPFSLSQLLAEVQIVMTPGLRKAGVQIHIKCEPDVELDSYPGALTQALMIVIQNTLTHAFEGKEQRDIYIQSLLIPPWGVQLSIRDNGIGVASDELNRIFDPFYTTKLGKGGSGLGLHICYNLITSTLGGKIRAASAIGQGLTVVMELPKFAPELANEPNETEL